MASKFDTSVTSVVTQAGPASSVVGTTALSAVLGYPTGSHVNTNVLTVVTQSQNALDILNGDAELGTTANWTVTSGSMLVWGSDGCNGTGNYFYNNNNASATMEQTIDVPSSEEASIDLGDRFLRLRYCVSGNINGGVTPTIEALNSASGLIQSKTTIPNRRTDWGTYDFDVPLPPLTRKIKVIFDLGAASEYGYVDEIKGWYLSNSFVAPETITNPGAETGDMSGWTVQADGISATSDITPHTGSYHISLGSASNTQYARAVQYTTFSAADLLAISAGNTVLTVNGWLANDNGDDSSRFSVNIYDSDNNFIENVTTGWITPTATWAEHSLVSATLPLDAAFFEILLDGEAVGGTPSLESYYDDISYTVLAGAAMQTRKSATYSLLEKAPAEYAYKLTSYSVLAPVLQSLKTAALTTYSIISPGPSLKGAKSSAYSVLKYAPVRSTKASTYSILSESVPAKTNKITSYSLLREPQMQGKKVTAYSLLEPVRAKALKVTGYSLLIPRPPSSRTNNLTTYSVLEPLPPVIATKGSAYSVLTPPPPRARVRKSNTYSVVFPIPPVTSYKVSSYSVLKPKPPVQSMKTTTYSVITPPPIALISKKVASYTILSPRPFGTAKVCSYSVLVPLSGIPSKAGKLTSYSVLKYTATVNPHKNIVVIIN